MPATPSVVVIPQRGEIVFDPGQGQTQHEIDVLFYHSKRQGDIPRRETERQRWLMSCSTRSTARRSSGSGRAAGTRAMPTDYEFATLPTAATLRRHPISGLG